MALMTLVLGVVIVAICALALLAGPVLPIAAAGAAIAGASIGALLLAAALGLAGLLAIAGISSMIVWRCTNPTAFKAFMANARADAERARATRARSRLNWKGKYR